MPDCPEAADMTTSVWSGVYSNAKEAEAVVGRQKALLFECPSWLIRQRALADQTAEFLRHGCQAPRPTLLPAVVAGATDVVVVDLGGGSGWVGSLLRGLGLPIRRYVVRDLPQVVDFHRQHTVEGIEYQYLDDTSLTHSSVDVLYANSCLQYMPDNDGLLDQVRRLRPRTMLVDELLWCRSDQDWFTIQANSDIPCVTRFASLHRLVTEAEHEGMRLAWEGIFGAGHRDYSFPDMSNFPDDLAIASAISLVFTRELGR